MQVKWQRLLPQHTLSRFLGYFSRRRLGFLTRWVIHWFVKHFQVNMTEALDSDLAHYKTFHDFFTRELQPQARPLAATPAVVCPVDGGLVSCGYMRSETKIYAKGIGYSLDALLANDAKLCQAFQGGAYFTAYLSPKDYHRVHIPCDGKLDRMLHVPGKLFSVDPQHLEKMPEVFANNERVICLFHSGKGPMAVIFVGALIVGSIATQWHGTVKSITSGVSQWNYQGQDLHFQRGAQIGHFALGSTVIVLFAEGAHTWSLDLQEDQVVELGQALTSD